MAELSDEELLKAVQENPDKMGENTKDGIRKGTLMGSCICIVLCTVMTCLDIWIRKDIDFGKPAILLVFGGVLNLFEYRAEPKKKTLVFCIAEFLLAAFCIIMYVGELFA